MFLERKWLRSKPVKSDPKGLGLELALMACERSVP